MSNTAVMTSTANNAELTEQEALTLAEIQDESDAFDMQPARVKIAPGGIGKLLLGEDCETCFCSQRPDCTTSWRGDMLCTVMQRYRITPAVRVYEEKSSQPLALLPAR